MSLKKVSVELQGITPLLMHRYPTIPIEAPEKKSPSEQAELSAYRDPHSGDLYIPAVAIQRALVGGAGYVRGKGRGSLAKVAAACLMVSPEYVSLGTKTFEVDARPVVIAATKGRIVRYRARLDSWKVLFLLEYDETLLSAKELRAIADATVSRVGLLDFRPAKGGSFGRSMIVSWKD